MITPGVGPAEAGMQGAVPTTTTDIFAPEADLAAAMSEAVSSAAARQRQGAAMQDSPAGFGLGGFSVTAGGTQDWTTDPRP